MTMKKSDLLKDIESKIEQLEKHLGQLQAEYNNSQIRLSTLKSLVETQTKEENDTDV